MNVQHSCLTQYARSCQPLVPGRVGVFVQVHACIIDKDIFGSRVAAANAGTVGEGGS